jgi:hypothetical protein
MSTKSAFAPKAISAIILVMVIVQVAPTGSAGAEQSWRLLDGNFTGTKANDGTVHHKDILMSKVGESSGTSTALSNSKSAWWYADEAVQHDIAFGESGWTVYVYHELTSGVTVYADIYVVKSNGVITHIAGGDVITNSSGQSKIACIDNASTSQLFQSSSGDRIGLRIRSTDADFTIYYYKSTGNKFSRLVSPSSDPGYPAPELPSVILFLSGIVIAPLIAFAGRKRR